MVCRRRGARLQAAGRCTLPCGKRYAHRGLLMSRGDTTWLLTSNNRLWISAGQAGRRRPALGQRGVRCCFGFVLQVIAHLPDHHGVLAADDDDDPDLATLTYSDSPATPPTVSPNVSSHTRNAKQQWMCATVRADPFPTVRSVFYMLFPQHYHRLPHRPGRRQSPNLLMKMAVLQSVRCL